MNPTIFTLTLRQLFGQRRSVLPILLALVPIGLAIIYNISDATDHHDWTANVLFDGIVITTVLPLACLILGASALGSEIDDGTIVYLLARPIARWEVIVSKFAAAAVATIAIVVTSAVLAGITALEGVPQEGLTLGFAVAALFGVAAYTAVFILLSVATSRPLVFGLAYVFIWEGLVTELFTGTRWVSIRQYCLGIADLISTVDERIFQAELDGAPALILVATVTLAALYIATRRLQRLEITTAD